VHVHRFVGPGDGEVGRVAGLEFEGAVGKTRRNRFSVPYDGRRAQVFGELIRFLQSLFLGGMGQKHAEFVAAEPSDHVAVAYMAEQRHGEVVEDRIAAGMPIRRWSRPEEQARVIAFLLSEDSCFMTGACIDSNGGAVMV